jgi:hypothetical protein
MAILRETISATGATGGAGLATATARSTHVIEGTIRAVYLAYLDSPPAGTTDVTIEGLTAPKPLVLSIANAATDAWFFPMNQADNTAGADITGMGSPVVVDDYLVVTIAQADNGDGVTATILWEDGRCM